MQIDDDREARPSRTSPIIIIEQIPWDHYFIATR